MCCCCRNLKGVSGFEIINFICILCTFISVGFKYLYDRIVSNKNLTSKIYSQYVDFSLLYFYYEAMSVFDALIVFMMMIICIKYAFFWLPPLK
jgi:hypothetical protein